MTQRRQKKCRRFGPGPGRAPVKVWLPRVRVAVAVNKPFGARTPSSLSRSRISTNSASDQMGLSRSGPKITAISSPLPRIRLRGARAESLIRRRFSIPLCAAFRGGRGTSSKSSGGAFVKGGASAGVGSPPAETRQAFAQCLASGKGALVAVI